MNDTGQTHTHTHTAGSETVLGRAGGIVKGESALSLSLTHSSSLVKQCPTLMTVSVAELIIRVSERGVERTRLTLHVCVCVCHNIVADWKGKDTHTTEENERPTIVARERERERGRIGTISVDWLDEGIRWTKSGEYKANNEEEHTHTIHRDRAVGVLGQCHTLQSLTRPVDGTASRL